DLVVPALNVDPAILYGDCGSADVILVGQAGGLNLTQPLFCCVVVVAIRIDDGAAESQPGRSRARLSKLVIPGQQGFDPVLGKVGDGQMFGQSGGGGGQARTDVMIKG